MKYHVNFEDMEAYKEAFKNKIDEFNDEVYNVFKSCQKVEWLGLGHDVTINAIYKKIEELEKISLGLSKFVEFIETASEEYTEGVKEVDTKFKEINEMIEAEKFKRGGDIV